MNPTVTESNQEIVNNNNNKIILTNGCFDLLHRGHVEYLTFIKKTENGKLIILLNSDISIKKIKGSTRPIINENDRKYILENLRCVDEVIVFDEIDISSYIEKIKPNVYYKSADYNLSTIKKSEYDELIKHNVEIKFAPLINGYSTTNTIKKINEINYRH